MRTLFAVRSNFTVKDTGATINVRVGLNVGVAFYGDVAVLAAATGRR